jgi:hypothetical protein
MSAARLWIATFLSTVGVVRGRHLWLAGGLAVLGALAMAGGAHACSCVDHAPRQALREADAAVVGRLVEAIPRDRYSADFRYRVLRVYKSGRGLAPGAELWVRSARGGAACGLPEGEGRYGLFLYRGEGRWQSNSCSLFDPGEMSRIRRGVTRNADIAASSSAAADCTS